MNERRKRFEEMGWEVFLKDRAGNLGQWMQLQKELFPIAGPDRCEWRDLEQISAVLNIIGNQPRSNYMFSPVSGGMTLEGSCYAMESGCLMLKTEGKSYVIRPVKLSFHSFPGTGCEWSYFSLATLRQNPIFGEPELRAFEDLYIDTDGELSGKGAYRQISDDAAEPVLRFFKGSFVIFARTSRYNHDGDFTDGRHDTYSEDGFRSFIETLSRIPSPYPPLP